jgi:hypothetical protein
MLNKTGSYIHELLANDEDFIKYEEEISNLLPKKLRNDNLGDDNMKILFKLEEVIMETAYLKGFADGLEESVTKKIKEDPEKYLNINEINSLLNDMGIYRAVKGAN